MSVWTSVSVLALRPLLPALPKAARLVAEASGCSGASAGVDAVERYLVTRFSDPSRRLPEALSRAADRAWRALEVAVAGESLWSKLVRHGEDKAYSVELRRFLDANPLRLTSGQGAAFREQACQELRAARKAGVVPGVGASADVLAKSVAELARFADPVALCQAEWQTVAVIAADLRAAGHTALAALLDWHPDAADPPLLAVAVRFFFRREVEKDAELFRGLVYEQVDRLQEQVRDGLAALETLGSKLLGVAEETRDNILDIKSELQRQGVQVQELAKAVLRALQQHQLDKRELHPRDSMSLCNDSERQLVKGLLARYRALPEEDRHRLPALLHGISRLEYAAGDSRAALQDFQRQVQLVETPAAKASAHYGAYLAALERQEDWQTALKELLDAARLDPERYAPFPLRKYAPERILGAGGFGVVFLCRDVDSGGSVALKSLRTDELDRDAAAVLAEAEQLEALEHENIIRLRTAGFADAARTRPYLVMSFFEGETLDEHVRKNGPLPPEESRAVALQIAAGLWAAHERNILHRDVKPANVLARKADGQWQVKLIDFGLALRRQAVQHTLSNAEALQSTARGRSIAGTLDYAAPEQMGKLRGASIGTHSDVYGFARTICFLLFKTPIPGPDDWERLTDEGFKRLLGKCLKEQPKDRVPDFAGVLAELRKTPATRAQNTGGRQLVAPPAPAPLLVNIEAIPAPQVATSNLPPLPEDILSLEGRLSGLRKAIEQVEQGNHPTIRDVWAALQNRKTTDGQPLIESVKRALEKDPSRSAAELCATAGDAPHASLVALINSLKRLIDLKEELRTTERKLHARQEEDFRAILGHIFGQQTGAAFPLGGWLSVEPQLHARRYAFVRNPRELLQKAEEHFAAAIAAREAERLRVKREQEQRQQQGEIAAQQRAAEQQQMQKEVNRQRRRQMHYTMFGVGGTVAGVVVVGGLGGLLGLVGWTTIVIPIIGLVVGVLGGALFGALCGAPKGSGSGPSDGVALFMFCTIVGAVLGGVVGLAYGIQTVTTRTHGWHVWEWSAGSGILWGGFAGAALGLVIGLIVAARNEPK